MLARLPARSAYVWIVLTVATLVIAAVLRYPSLHEPLWYGDEGIFAAIATNLREGRTLYADAWDNKPPMVFYTYAAIQAASGSGVFPLHVTASIVVLATQATVIAIAFLLYDGRRAAVAGVLFAVLMSTPIIEGTLALTETFMILPTTLAVLTVVIAARREEPRRTAPIAVAGVLLGIAANYKQVAVFDAAAVAVMLWLTWERPLPALAALAAGFAVPHAVFAAIFVAAGAFGDYAYAVAGSLGLYTRAGPEQDPIARAAGLLPALLVVAWLVRRHQRGDPVDAQHLPVLWLGFALAGATSSAFAFPHYLQQAAPAAVLTVAGVSIADLRRDADRVVLGVAGALMVAVIFAQFSFAFEERRQLDPVDYYRTYLQHRRGDMTDLDYEYSFDGKAVAVRDIAALIKQDAAGDTLFAWSELPWLYAAVDMTNPARYYTSFLGELVPGAKEEIVRNLEARPPVYVLLSDDTYAPFDDLERFAAERYVLLRAQGDWRLYRLATLPGRLPLATQTFAPEQVTR
ncbi:MAG: glycosyltransferase family 39 protein [Dehalococcoidia bacterium]